MGGRWIYECWLSSDLPMLRLLILVLAIGRSLPTLLPIFISGKSRNCVKHQSLPLSFQRDTEIWKSTTDRTAAGDAVISICADTVICLPMVLRKWIVKIIRLLVTRRIAGWFLNLIKTLNRKSYSSVIRTCWYWQWKLSIEIWVFGRTWSCRSAGVFRWPFS